MSKFHGDNPFPLHRRGNSAFQQIVCDRCGVTDDHAVNNGLGGPEILTRYWRVRGWLVDLRKRSFICPQCQKREADARKNEKEAKKMEKMNGTMPGPQPSPSSALAKKIMSDLLFDHYDLSAQDYKEGWDDKRVAQESGLSEAFVSQRRAADYGPVKPKKPPAAKIALNALSNSQVALKDLIARAGAMEAKGRELLALVDRAVADISIDPASK